MTRRFLQVERCDPRHGSHFAEVHDSFLQQLHVAASNVSAALRQQEYLVGALSQAAAVLKASGESRPKRMTRLQAMFEGSELLSPLKSTDTSDSLRALLLPLDPRVRIVASIPQRAMVFKSAMSPLGLTFQTAEVLAPQHVDAMPREPQLYSVIFKSGDDIRQDQLVLEMILLMDKLLQVAPRHGTDESFLPFSAHSARAAVRTTTQTSVLHGD